MLKSLIDQQKRSMHHFFEGLNLSPIEHLVNHLEAGHGTTFVTGVGKSGHIAQKMAATLTSIGTKALYLSPLDAFHGDLALVQPKDTLLLLSRSGETEELLRLAQEGRGRLATTFAIVSREKSRLAQDCDHTIYLPLDQELCPFGLAPTTSSALQLLLSDLVAMALMRKKELSLDQYAANHPAGQIGKRARTFVRDLMVTGADLPLAYRGQTLVELLPTLSSKMSGCLLLVDEQNQLLGIFTDGDLRRVLQNLGSEALRQPIEQLVHAKPLTIGADSLAWEAVKEMETYRSVTVLPVVEKGILLGLIRLHDILKENL